MRYVWTALLLSFAGCSRGEPPVLVPDPAPRGATAGPSDAGATATPADASATTSAAPADASARATTLPPAAAAAIEQALGAYESIRKALANDSTEGVAALGTRLAEASTAARAALGGEADAAVATALESLAKEAHGLGAGDIEAVREQFGRTSKALIALGARVPAVRAGRQVFECPMTSHYKKWIQTEDKLENPLQGQKMLTCGEASSWVE